MHVALEKPHAVGYQPSQNAGRFVAPDIAKQIVSARLVDGGLICNRVLTNLYLLPRATATIIRNAGQLPLVAIAVPPRSTLRRLTSAVRCSALFRAPEYWLAVVQPRAKQQDGV